MIEITKTPAPAGTKCGFSQCATGKDAVHVFEGKALCPFHSPFDVDSPAESPAQELDPAAAENVTEKGIEEVETDDLLVTQHGLVHVTNRITDLSPRTGTIYGYVINRRYTFQPGARVLVHADPKAYRRARWAASRELIRKLTVEGAKVK